jgi:hypothetical protein
MRFWCIAVLLIFTLLLPGCGSDSSTPATPSPFAGQFEGTFTDPVNNQNGTMAIKIANTGMFSGTITNLTENKTAPVSGQITSNGGSTFAYSYGAGQGYTGTSTLTKQANGHLTGKVSLYKTGTYVSYVNVDLAPQ